MPFFAAISRLPESGQRWRNGRAIRASLQEMKDHLAEIQRLGVDAIEH